MTFDPPVTDSCAGATDCQRLGATPNVQNVPAVVLIRNSPAAERRTSVLTDVAKLANWLRPFLDRQSGRLPDPGAYSLGVEGGFLSGFRTPNRD